VNNLFPKVYCTIKLAFKSKNSIKKVPKIRKMSATLQPICNCESYVCLMLNEIVYINHECTETSLLLENYENLVT